MAKSIQQQNNQLVQAQDGQQMPLSGAPRFVQVWLDILHGMRMSISTGQKSWQLIENHTDAERRAHQNFQRGDRKVIPITHSKPAQDNRALYRMVTENLVMEHCFGPLTLPGFTAFLQGMTRFQQAYSTAFQENPVFSKHCHSLVTGYWKEVKPSGCCPAELGNDQGLEDAPAANAQQQALLEAQQAIAKYEKSAKSANPRIQAAFMKEMKNDLTQALGSSPSAMPSPARPA